jgi:hypothetical protein
VVPSLLQAAVRVSWLNHYEMALPAIHGHQVGHQFPGHRQGCAIGIAFLFFRSYTSANDGLKRGAILAASDSTLARAILANLG